jgi:hypothetical protein
MAYSTHVKRNEIFAAVGTKIFSDFFERWFHTIWQQDGALPHCHSDLKWYLNQTFQGDG